MRSKTVALAALGLILSGAITAHAIEYNYPEPPQKYPGKGWLIDSGNDHRIHFKAYVEDKELFVTEEAIYYLGWERVEGADNPAGVIHWRFMATCAVRPDLKGKVPLGIAVHQTEGDPEQFTPIDPMDEHISNASRGWHRLWWAVCRDKLKDFGE
jgi:hypothetical protein